MKFPLFILFIAMSQTLFGATGAQSTEYEVVNRQAIDRVWSGNYAGFDFLTEGSHQVIAYYDANRQMTVAHRKTRRSPWIYYKVDSWLGWDSHNYVVVAFDSDGHLHLSGNIHANRIEYFRTRIPRDVRSLERVEVMENAELETRATYPRFLKRDNGELLFKYRSGGSGDGVDIYLVYDTETRKWNRLHDSPLLDGEGLMNAYAEGPLQGPDGRFHMAWIWRDTPDAATNHDISYARSADLINWEDSSGTPIPLPITFGKSEIVDPVPAHGGAINGNNKLGFDVENRPLIAFHKFDGDGNTQIYIRRREAGGWISHQITDWKDFRWEFGGFGALPFVGLRLQSPVLLPDGNIKLPIRKENERLALIIDGNSLQLLDIQETTAYPPVLSEVASSSDVLLDGRVSEGAELVFRTLKSKGLGPEDDLYYLTWEAQGAFRDQARDAIPPASTLILHQIRPHQP
jgi:hypothetical protein